MIRRNYCYIGLGNDIDDYNQRLKNKNTTPYQFYKFRDEACSGDIILLYQNKQGYLKPRFTKESRIKMLKTLYQFRNYTDNDFEKYYQEKIIPRLNNRTSEYNRRRTHIRKNAYRNIFREKSISGQLTEILRYVKKKQRVRDKDH